MNPFEYVMRSSKRQVVAGVSIILLAALAANASRSQAQRNDPKTRRIRIVTVVKLTGIGWFEHMERASNSLPRRMASMPPWPVRPMPIRRSTSSPGSGWIAIDKSNVKQYPFRVLSLIDA
jgi:hypothetical protein